MTLLNKRERDAILTRFPKAEIVSTRHRYYLVGNGVDEPSRLLLDLRGLPQPPSRKAKARSGYTGNRPRTW